MVLQPHQVCHYILVHGVCHLVLVHEVCHLILVHEVCHLVLVHEVRHLILVHKVCHLVLAHEVCHQLLHQFLVEDTIEVEPGIVALDWGVELVAVVEQGVALVMVMEQGVELVVAVEHGVKLEPGGFDSSNACNSKIPGRSPGQELPRLSGKHFPYRSDVRRRCTVHAYKKSTPWSKSYRGTSDNWWRPSFADFTITDSQDQSHKDHHDVCHNARLSPN